MNLIASLLRIEPGERMAALKAAKESAATRVAARELTRNRAEHVVTLSVSRQAGSYEAGDQ
jgi:hypothetical protein